MEPTTAAGALRRSRLRPPQLWRSRECGLILFRRVERALLDKCSVGSPEDVRDAIRAYLCALRRTDPMRCDPPHRRREVIPPRSGHRSGLERLEELPWNFHVALFRDPVDPDLELLSESRPEASAERLIDGQEVTDTGRHYCTPIWTVADRTRHAHLPTCPEDHRRFVGQLNAHPTSIADHQGCFAAERLSHFGPEIPHSLRFSQRTVPVG